MDKKTLKSFVKRYVFGYDNNPTDAPFSVIGYPRTGFTLLLSFIAQILNFHGVRTTNELQLRYQHAFSEYVVNVNNKLNNIIKSRKLDGKLVFNANFHPPLGGPNWIDGNNEDLCVRKYIGIKDLGDLTLIIKLPKWLLNWHKIPHSHGPLSPWMSQEDNKRIFHTVRSPSGTINSACHSINAIASEYIQRWYPALNIPEETKLRESLAMSKLSNMNFFSAMAEPMRQSFLDLCQHQQRVDVYKWENMIGNPAKLMVKLGVDLGLPVDKELAQAIWNGLSGKNLTQSHKHNYRPNSGDTLWHEKTLTNEHTDLLIEMGFDKLAGELGVSPPKYIDESNYTGFQKMASAALKSGKTIDEVDDRELYWFAFQKTNIDFTKFNFKTYDWREYTKLERTNIQDEGLVEAIWSVFESEVRSLQKKL